MVIKAKNHIAARQFLREMTYRSQHAEVEGSLDYPKAVVLKGVALADALSGASGGAGGGGGGASGGGGREWLEGVY